MARYDIEQLKQDIQQGIDGALRGVGAGTQGVIQGIQTVVNAIRSDVGRTVLTIVQILSILRREFPQVTRWFSQLQQRLGNEINKVLRLAQDKFRGIERTVTRNFDAVNKLTRDFQKKPGEIVRQFEKFATARAKDVTRNVDTVRKNLDGVSRNIQRIPSELQKTGTKIVRDVQGAAAKEIGKLPRQFEGILQKGVGLPPKDQQKIVADLDRLYKQTAKASGSEIAKQLAGYGDGMQVLKSIGRNWDEVAQAAAQFGRIFRTLSKVLPILSDFLNGLQINAIERTVNNTERRVERLELLFEQAQIKIRLDAIAANVRGLTPGGTGDSNADLMRAIEGVNRKLDILNRGSGGVLTRADVDHVQAAVLRALSTLPQSQQGASPEAIASKVSATLGPQLSDVSDKVGKVGGHVLRVESKVENIKVSPPDLGALQQSITGVNQAIAGLPDKILGPFNAGVSGINANLAALPSKIQVPRVDLGPIQNLLAGQSSQLQNGLGMLRGDIGALAIQGNGLVAQNTQILQAVGALRNAPAPTINYQPPPITVNAPPVDLLPIVGAINGLYNPIQLTYNVAAEGLRVGQLNYNQIAGLRIPTVDSAAITNGVVGALNPKIDEIRGIGDKTYQLVGGDTLRNGLATALPDKPDIPVIVGTLSALTLATAALTRDGGSGPGSMGGKLDAIKAVVDLNGEKLGPKLSRDGLAGWVTRFNRRFDFSAVTNSLTLIVALHNAAMLSQNLAQTLGDVASQALQAMGLKGDDGAAIDVNEILGKQINSFFEGLLGAEVWTGVKTSWKKANRIIQVGSSIIWSVRSIMDSARDLQEWTASNLGKWMNAAKRDGVVRENAYPWQSENVRAQNKWFRAVDRYRENIENLDDAASSLSSVTSNVLSIQDEFGQLKEQKTEFETLLQTGLSENKPANNEQSARAVAAAAASVVPAEIPNTALTPGE